MPKGLERAAVILKTRKAPLSQAEYDKVLEADYDAHRADVDCFALLEVLQQKLPKSGELVLKSILNSLGQKSYTIYAIGSSFDTKDTLKARAYRWDGDKKCWHITVTGDESLKAELAWFMKLC